MTTVVVVGAGLLYGLRGPIGTRLAVDYLARRGVPADIAIDRLDLGGFSGRVRLGPAADPDLTVDRVEAVFEPIPIFKSGLAAPRLHSLRLVHPRLKAGFDGRRLSFGTLQPLIDDALKGTGAGPGPDVQVERGELRLFSFAGSLLVTGDAALSQGRLRRANAHLATTRLTLRPDLVVGVQGADVALTSRADRLNADVSLTLSAVGGAVKAGPGHVAMTLSLPYSEQGFTQFDGPLAAELHFNNDGVSARGATARGLAFSGRFGGAVHGPLASPTLDLTGEASGAADQVNGPGKTIARKVQITGSGAGLHWSGGADAHDLTATTIDLKAQADTASRDGGPALVGPTVAVGLSDLKALLGRNHWSGRANLALNGKAGSADQTTPAGNWP